MSVARAYLPFESAVQEPADAPPDLAQFDEIELDFETEGLNFREGHKPVGVAIGTPVRQYYVAWGHRGGGNSTDEATAQRWLRSIRGKYIRNLSTKQDLHFGRAGGVDLRDQDNRFHDVAHSAALLDDHRKKFSLQALAEDELGESKGDVVHASAIADLPATSVAPYAKQDVRLVRRLAEVYAPRLAAEGLERVSRLEDDLIPAVVEMEVHGIPLNLPLLEHWLMTSKALLEKLSWEFYKLCGFVINPDAPTDMVRLWLQCKEPIERTETGAPSFTAPIVQAAATRHPAILLAWRLGKLMDLRSKYLEKYAKDQIKGVLYPELHQLRTDDGGTVSGRFSCVRPNMQQVMGKDKHGRAYGWVTDLGDEDYLIKRLCVPASGVWFSTDAKQIEYRIFAHYTDSARLIQAYAENPEMNFHHFVRDHMLIHAKPDITHTEVKVSNFLSIFGGGIGALQRNLHITMEAAQEIADAYDRQFPEKRVLLQKAMDSGCVTRVR